MTNVIRPLILLFLSPGLFALTLPSFANTLKEIIDTRVEQKVAVKGGNKQISPRQVAEEYRELNPAERELVNSSPSTATATAIISDTRKAADEVTRRFYGNLDDDGTSNAFRHCYWSGLMTHLTGRDFAKLWGDAHERYQQNPSGVWRRTPPKSPKVAMDLYNNDVGREVGTRARDFQDIATFCRSLEQSGKLRVLKR